MNVFDTNTFVDFENVLGRHFHNSNAHGVLFALGHYGYDRVFSQSRCHLRSRTRQTRAHYLRTAQHKLDRPFVYLKCQGGRDKFLNSGVSHFLPYTRRQLEDIGGNFSIYAFKSFLNMSTNRLIDGESTVEMSDTPIWKLLDYWWLLWMSNRFE